VFSRAALQPLSRHPQLRSFRFELDADTLDLAACAGTREPRLPAAREPEQALSRIELA
jgi:hypothetical protein